MSKAAAIKELLDTGKSTREIADSIGCLPEYVRVIKQRRVPGGKSFADRMWLINNRDKHLESLRKCNARRYHAVDCETRFEITQRVRQAYIEAGFSAEFASRQALNAIMRYGAKILRSNV